MQRNSLFDFIFFGTSFRFLQDVKGGQPYANQGYVKENLQFVFNFLEKNNMRVSSNAAYDLKILKSKWDEKYNDQENNEFSADDSATLRSEMNNLRLTVMSESQEVSAYFANEKRYNAVKLFTDPQQIFGSDTFVNLPLAAQDDFSEACKCILLERGTAAAFHLLRGTECTLKHLYFSVVKRGRKNPAMWGNMVAHLNERKALTISCKGMLDVFRTGFRNPTAHPEKFYSVDEAQDLLGTTIQLVALICAQNGYEIPSDP